MLSVSLMRSLSLIFFLFLLRGPVLWVLSLFGYVLWFVGSALRGAVRGIWHIYRPSKSEQPPAIVIDFREDQANHDVPARLLPVEQSSPFDAGDDDFDNTEETGGESPWDREAADVMNRHCQTTSSSPTPLEDQLEERILKALSDQEARSALGQVGTMKKQRALTVTADVDFVCVG